MIGKLEGKMKENEENRDLNDKKAYEDQFTIFISLVLELSFSFFY